jgi:acetoacetate decarboxylase
MHEGRLKAAKFGYDMPVDAPLYAKPPIYYKDVHTISVTWETDLDAALDLLPEGLELEPPAIASIIFARYPFSTLGPYNETILGIACSCDGTPGLYIPHIVVDSEVPLAAGREIWGYPKKFAHIEIDTDAPGDVLSGRMERPRGNLLCGAGVRPEWPIRAAGEPTDGYSMALRVIPAPEENGGPSLAQLIRTHTVTTVKEEWEGTGWVEFYTHSNVDPWHKLNVEEVVDARYRISDMTLGFGKVVRSW